MRLLAGIVIIVLVVLFDLAMILELVTEHAKLWLWLAIVPFMAVFSIGFLALGCGLIERHLDRIQGRDFQ